MAEAQMIELLQGMQSTDKGKRSQATQMYKDAKEKSPDELIVTLMKVVMFEAAPQADKKSALVYLRQLVSKDRKDEFIFAKIAEANKQEVAQGLIIMFEGCADEKVQTSIGNVIVSLAEYVCDEDDPRGYLVQGQSCGWPTLLPAILKMANVQENQKGAVSVSAGMKTLKELIPSMKAEIVRNQPAIGAVVQNALGCPELTVKTAAALLICDMVEILDKKNWAPLASTVPVLTQVCMELARNSKTSELEEIMQAFISVAGIEPDFFKNSMGTAFEPAKFFSGCVKSKDAGTDIRQLALEWIITYSEKKPKWLTKSCPNYAQVAIECCMAMMLEIEDSESDLKAWAERMDDEEGEEDADDEYHTGEECIDRLVEALSMEVVSPPLFQAIGAFQAQGAWQAKHAALATVKQTVEYVEDRNHMCEMAKLLMAHVTHEHPRVRYTALHAIGQLANDQAPQFQEAFHKEVMPLLITCMDDKVDRVAAMAMSAFVSFAEELKDLMHMYSHQFMEKFLSRLQSSQHRGIQEESITAIAVIAAVINQDFQQYYGTTMPMLKQLIMNCTSEKQQRLRGKAFECLSLLGVAVGKQKFAPDAQEAITAMLTSTGVDADDIQRQYIKEAIERICHCLKKDFVQFLPMVLPGIYKSLSLEEDASIIPRSANADGDAEDESHEVTVNGKLVKVKTSKLEEMEQAVSMLNTFISTMEGSFYDAIQPTANALLPIIRFTDDAAILCADARGEALTTWAHLIKAAKDGAAERNIQAPVPMVTELVTTIVTECTNTFVKEQQNKDDIDTEGLGWTSSGLSEALKNAGPGYLPEPQAVAIIQQLFVMIDESFVRSEKLKVHLKNQSVGVVAPELQGDEDDEDTDPLGDENGLRRCLEESLGAVMKANPDAIAKDVQGLAGKMSQWMSTKENMVLGLHMACDMLEHLKERSCPVWPTFMPQIFNAIEDKDPDCRIAAAYAINLASGIPAFQEAAPDAFRRIAKLVGGKAPKKRDEKAVVAMDNAVAALFALARNMINACPPEINGFGMFVGALPLKGDFEEAKKVHLLVCQLLMQQHAGLVGANQENLGKILSVLAEIHKQEDTSNDEIDGLILQIFTQLPRDVLAKCASSFTEKQQKRIEKILTPTA